MNSRIVVDWLRKGSCTLWYLWDFWEDLVAELEGVNFMLLHQYREGNSAADFLARDGEMGKNIIYEDPDLFPRFLKGVLRIDRSRAALCLKEGNTRKYCGEITVKAVWSYVKKILKGSTGNWITFVLWIISISLDPFICYVPSIDDKNKKLKINSSLLISIWVLYWSLLIYRMSISFCTENKGTRRVFNQAESIALLCSNVLLYSLFLGPKMEISAPVFSVVLGLFLAVYLVRIIGIYRLFSEEVTKSTSSKLAEAPIIKIVFNLLLFLYGGHLFGGLWYLFAVWKERACWKKLKDHKLLNDTCFANLEEDTKPYEIGIFKDAFESRIVEESWGLWRKLLYCFRWGIQNISGFGQNLQVSTYAWENIFVILIAIYGVGTFTFFIGNMQNLIKSAIDERRKQADRAIKQQLQQWFTFGKLSENLQNCIKEYHQYNGQQTGGVDVKNLFRNLPKDIGNNLKHELCLELLKKVERFRRWSDASLCRLCDCVEPIVYAEHTRIVREGDPINKMLFVLNGQLAASSRNKLAASSTKNVSPKEILKGGDFWGEELVNWVQDKSSSSSSSKKLISLTKVEAFVLKIDGLKKLFHEKAKIIQSWFRKRKNNARCCEFGNLSLCRYRCGP
ncbi:hypothetical protein LWI29_035225 [Acer saccharum]|uniref:Cyclic nucleotide-binding domain-containing protein n=1 Tax=Acer saccharum TaxID=4024 RepID=A0AA39W142_ACESA|nr:hypothetical protein LWI29_035225 [Acer saccharum]